MEKELKEELESVLEELEEGAEFSVTKGIAGFDISDELNAFIYKLLKGYLQYKDKGEDKNNG